MSVKTGIKVAVAGAIAYGAYAAFNFGMGFYELATFYDPEKITVNFRTTATKFPHRVMKPADVWTFDRADTEITLPETFIYNGQERSFAALLETTGTTGLIIVKDDKILFEKYYQGEKETDKHAMFSVTKSFVSALFGMTLEQGLIESIEDPVTKYLPELNDSGYKDVKIRDLLTMSSGILFDENYGDMNSDVNRMSMAIATGGSLDEFAASLTREREPGTFNHYVSVDTHVLGMIITRVTGRTLTDLLTEKIWHPLGMEHDSIWMIDGEGMEVAMGGMQVTLRDMAHFGRLYLHDGNWNGQQIVPAKWVRDSVTPSAPHLMPGAENPGSDTPFGYGFQWWIPSNPHGDFMAAGIYDQFIYIDPTSGMIIAKTSANKRYVDPTAERTMDPTITALQQIAAEHGSADWSKVNDALAAVTTN